MPVRFLILTLSFLIVSPGVSRCLAQESGAFKTTPPGVASDIDQNETLLDTLKRMQIKREEDEFRKLTEKAATIRDGAGVIASEIAATGAHGVARRHEKRLREMEKFARQIRSESGGSGEPETKVGNGEEKIETLVELLVESSERLKQALARTSRRVVSIGVVEGAGDVIELTRRLRLHLK